MTLVPIGLAELDVLHLDKEKKCNKKMFDYIPAKDSPRMTIFVLLDATPSEFPSQLK